MHCVMSMGRRVRACTRLSVAAKALATRDHVKDISGPSALSNRCTSSKPPKDADGLRFYENTVLWANRDNSASAPSYTSDRPYLSELRGCASNG
jgi:hypothetical protein